MNGAIRAKVRKRISEQGKTQTAIAQEIGVQRQYLGRMLNEQVGDVPPSWDRLLNALDLELVVQPKGRTHDQ